MKKHNDDKRHQSTVYIMIGVPGSGKSTYIAHHLPIDTTSISRDQIRIDMGLCGPDGKCVGTPHQESLVTTEFWNQINDALVADQDDNIAIDNTSLTVKRRQELVDGLNTYCDRFKDLLVRPKIVYVFCKTPEMATILSRRESQIPRGALAAMMSKIEEPDPKKECWDELIEHTSDEEL